jgi:hypothetical protein
VSAVEITGVRVPSKPEAKSPISAVELEGARAPSKPEAETPVNATVMTGVVTPTLPEAASPVSAATTVCPLSELNGASENGKLPNIDYAVIPRPV